MALLTGENIFALEGLQDRVLISMYMNGVRPLQSCYQSCPVVEDVLSSPALLPQPLGFCLFNGQKTPPKWGQWTAALLVLFQMVNIIFMIERSKYDPSVMCY